MKASFKLGMLALCVAAFTMGFSSCKDDDGVYNPEPPTIETVNAISGSVAAINGDAIAGATVTISGPTSVTVTTDANGAFYVPNLEPGTYTVTVEAPGKISKTTTITITNDGKGHTAVWNAVLAGENSQLKVDVSVDNGGEGEEVSEALKGNDLAEIPIEVDVDPGALSKDCQIIIVPIYTSEEGELLNETRADEEIVLIGADISCTDPTVEIIKPIDLTFAVDPLTIEHVTTKKLVGNSWVDVPHQVDGDNIVLAADEFTSYALFGPVVFTSTGRDVALTMTPSEWNNIDGTGVMHADNSTFQYKVGMEIVSKGTTVFTALLIEALARHYGVNNFTTNGTYPLNVDLPLGTALWVSGVQRYYDVSAALGGLRVNGVHYGDVLITTRTTTQGDHNGGGSRP